MRSHFVYDQLGLYTISIFIKSSRLKSTTHLSRSSVPHSKFNILCNLFSVFCTLPFPFTLHLEPCAVCLLFYPLPSALCPYIPTSAFRLPNSKEVFNRLRNGPYTGDLDPFDFGQALEVARRGQAAGKTHFAAFRNTGIHLADGSHFAG